MFRITILLSLVAGCAPVDELGPEPPDGAQVDPDAAAAADGPACASGCEVDASGWLPVNAACEPNLDQCAVGLTCRIRAAHDGLCRPVGPLAEGDVCTSVDECGANMACITARPGTLRCQTVCEVAQSSPRCGTRGCAPFWGTETGVCR